MLSIACVNSGADLQPLAEDGAVLSNLAGPCTCGCCTEILRGSGRFLDGGALALERPGSPGTPGPGPRESSLAAKNTSKALRPSRQGSDTSTSEIGGKSPHPGELAKHAVSEGTKAVTKYTSA